MSKSRKPLSKRVRFDVFKRDLFTCQYCGGTPPRVVLEIDHIEPVSQGGTDHKDNLVTACFDCNRGKSDRLLSDRDLPLSERASRAAEKEEQVRAYRRLQKRIRNREDADINLIEQVVTDHFGLQFTPKFHEDVRTSFLDHFEVYELTDFMHRACCKRPDDPELALKYFCGICWNEIRARKGGRDA